MTDTATKETNDLLAARNGELVLRVKRLEEALAAYASGYCEGWCEDAPPHAMFDCGGCPARAALRKGEA